MIVVEVLVMRLDSGGVFVLFNQKIIMCLLLSVHKTVCIINTGQSCVCVCGGGGEESYHRLPGKLSSYYYTW